jgi:hypothetical protein
MVVFSKALSLMEVSGAKLMQASDKLDTQFLKCSATIILPL